MRKTGLALFMTMVIISAMVLSAAGVASDNQDDPEERYAYINAIEVVLQKNSAGNAVCKCKVIPQSGYTVQVTMRLTPSTYSWTASGSMIFMDQTCPVPSSGSYQTGVLVFVYNSAGVQVNAFTKYSPSLYF